MRAWKPVLWMIASAAMACQGVTAAAAAKADAAPHKLLYVGNSFYYYNNSLHNQVNRLLNVAMPDKQVRAGYTGHSLTISGGHLAWHNVGAYLDAGIGSSAFDDNNELVPDASRQKIDAVLMMDCSRCPLDEPTRKVFHDVVRKHSRTVRSKGAEPLLFMSWAYADKPEMIDVVSREYIKAARDNGLRLVPAGLAFQRAKAERPQMVLHAPDRRHPSPAGTYLAACAVLASIYGLDPRGNTHWGGLPEEEASYLQSVAWQTVREFESATRR